VFPERWAVLDQTDDHVEARIDESPDGPIVVEASRVGTGWMATVTRVGGGQRHRLATLVRPRLDEAVEAADVVVPHVAVRHR
jgi:hypothetical protein